MHFILQLLTAMAVMHFLLRMLTNPLGKLASYYICTFHEYCFPLRLKSPVNRQHSRDTLTSTSNGYYGSGHLHSSISKPEPYDRDKMVSPPYNRLGESPIPNGVILPIGIKTDSVICLLYTSPSPRDATLSRMPSSA